MWFFVFEIDQALQDFVIILLFIFFSNQIIDFCGANLEKEEILSYLCDNTMKYFLLFRLKQKKQKEILPPAGGSVSFKANAFEKFAEICNDLTITQ